MYIELLLKNIRKEKKITLKQLSDMTGISKTHINDIEKNYKVPSLVIAIKIAVALNIKLTDLYKIHF